MLPVCYRIPECPSRSILKYTDCFLFFYVLLTVHIGITLVNAQLSCTKRSLFPLVTFQQSIT